MLPYQLLLFSQVKSQHSRVGELSEEESEIMKEEGVPEVELIL